jgi:predicted aspartyl protease
MSVEANILDVKSKLLVDTGATVTVLSKAVFDRLHKIALNDTKEVAQDILSAAEEPLKTYGKITRSVLEILVSSNPW